MQMSGTSNVCRKLQLMLCARRCVIPHLGSPAGAWPPCTPHSWAGACSPRSDRAQQINPLQRRGVGTGKHLGKGKVASRQGGGRGERGLRRSRQSSVPIQATAALQARPSSLSLQYTTQGILQINATQPILCTKWG